MMTPEETSILVVEDDCTLQEVLAYNLSKEGYRVLEAVDGGQALEIFRNHNPSLILLDLLLPVMSGLEVCRIVRGERKTPIIILTAKTDEVDKVVGLELGADDYLTKPFSMKELLARIKSVLRRVSRESWAARDIKHDEQQMEVADIRVDLAGHAVFRGEKPVELNPKEFELLALLISSRGRLVGREEAMKQVWGYDYVGNTRTIDVHMRWLRQKLEVDPDNPVHLITVRGYGYKFEPG